MSDPRFVNSHLGGVEVVRYGRAPTPRHDVRNRLKAEGRKPSPMPKSRLQSFCPHTPVDLGDATAAWRATSQASLQSRWPFKFLVEVDAHARRALLEVEFRCHWQWLTSTLGDPSLIANTVFASSKRRCY
jgi:hypothetical protein